jgi:hypothetical protein
MIMDSKVSVKSITSAGLVGLRSIFKLTPINR